MNKWIFSVEMSKLRSDIVLVLMVMKGLVKVEADKLFQFLKDLHTRGHKLQIIKQICRLNIRNITFSQRVIAEWSNLPLQAATAKTVHGFKEVINSCSSKIEGYIYVEKGCLPHLLGPIIRSQLDTRVIRWDI